MKIRLESRRFQDERLKIRLESGWFQGANTGAYRLLIPLVDVTRELHGAECQNFIQFASHPLRKRPYRSALSRGCKMPSHVLERPVLRHFAGLSLRPRSPIQPACDKRQGNRHVVKILQQLHHLSKNRGSHRHREYRNVPLGPAILNFPVKQQCSRSSFRKEDKDFPRQLHPQ